MVVGDAHFPLLDGQFAHPRDDGPALFDPTADLGASEHEGTGICRIGEKIMDRRVGRLRPSDSRRARRASWEQQSVDTQ